MEKKKRTKWKYRIKQEQNFECACCHHVFEPNELQIHHIKNRCRGGLSTKENCVGLCIECHKWIHETYGNDYCDPR